MPTNHVENENRPCEPIPCSNLGFHSGRITSMHASADGSLLLSVGNDDPLRTWRWNGRHLAAEALYRVPCCGAGEGHHWCGAMGPEGRWLLAGAMVGYFEDGRSTVPRILRKCWPLGRPMLRSRRKWHRPMKMHLRPGEQHELH
jgi:WD40 repeat protein